MKTGRAISTACAWVMLYYTVCHAGIQSHPQKSRGVTRSQTESTSPTSNHSFEQGFSKTVLGFGLYNCRSTLQDIDRAIDKVTVRTQPDYFASLQQRYGKCKDQYAQLYTDGSKAPGHREAPERASLQQRLNELESLLLETGVRLEHRNDEYIRQRRQYESGKKLSFMDLQHTLRQRESVAQRFYVDARLSIGVSAVEVTLSHVLLTLEAYATQLSPRVPEENLEPTQKEGLSSAEGLEDYVSLVDQDGRPLGRPQDIQYDRLHSMNGLVMTVAFARDLTSEGAPIQLRINPSPLGNAEPIALVIHPEQEQARFVRALEEECRRLAATSEESTATGVIHCVRENGLLKIPVRVQINGVEVETSMLLDTGASMTLLSKSVYNRGLTRSMGELKTLSLQTANGPMTCPVECLRVSTTAFAKELPVALTDDSRSLLGMDYWAGRQFTIDLDRACIYVHRQQP